MSFFKDLVNHLFETVVSSKKNVPQWIIDWCQNKFIISVVIKKENKGGYIVKFKDSTEGFMPQSESGFKSLNPGDSVEVVVIDIKDDDSIIVSIKAANKIYKENLVKKAEKLLDIDDAEHAMCLWNELKEQWDALENYQYGSELWERFREVRKQINIKCEEQKEREKQLSSQIEINKVYNGTVIKIIPKIGVNVRLAEPMNKIEGFVHIRNISHGYIDNISDIIKIGNEVRVVVLHVNSDNQKPEFGMKQLETPNRLSKVSRCSSGEDSEKTAIRQCVVDKIKFPGMVLTESFDDYLYGIILPNDITLNGTPICASARWDFINRTYSKGTQIQAILIGELEDERVAFLQNDIRLPSETVIAAQREISEVEVTDINESYIQVKTEDQRLAYIALSEFCEEIPDRGKKLKAKLVDNGDNILQYPRYSILSLEEAYNLGKVIIDGDGRLSEIFEDEELKELCKKGKNELEEVIKILDEYPELKEPNYRKELKVNIWVKANEKSEIYRGKFLKEHPDYFKDKSFKVYADDYERIYLWDEYGVLIIISCENGILILKKIYENYDNKSIKKYRKSKLLISGSRLKIIPYLSSESPSEAAGILQKVKAIQRINKLKYDLGNDVCEEVDRNADIYYHAAKFLEWQIKQEKKKTGSVIRIHKNDIVGRDLGNSGGITYQIRIPNIDRLINQEYITDLSNEDCLRVSIMKYEDSDNYVSATLENISKDTWLLEFAKDNKSANWIEDGFYIKYKPSIRHLKEQFDAIENYKRNDSLDLLTDMVYKQIADIDTSKYDNIEFFNPIFKEVQDDNSQVEAIKKALAAKKIMLIQGPPGTGKSTVIVEIIRQLVQHENMRVLVCCQAHPAVDNIYDKLEAIGKENPRESLGLIRVKNEGKIQNNDIEKHSEQFKSFLQQQCNLLNKLVNGCSIAGINQYVDQSSYNSESKLIDAHIYLTQNFMELSDIDSTVLIDAFKELSGDEDFHRFYNNADSNFHNADVVLGTCIGVGVTRGLSKGMFDVVIIDEAAKANIGESIVPMSLGKKYILVGDHHQLPPYVDSAEINRYVEDSNFNNKVEGREEYSKVIEYQKKSLFEEFYCKIHESCVVKLNYQHRMNPDIGKCISELFYSNEIQNGPHTSAKVVESSMFPENVVFIDTSNIVWAKNTNEKRNRNGSLYNKGEVDIICKHIIPHIDTIIGAREPEDFLGIISPYAEQVNQLRKSVPERFKACVHTIDSIQGSEYDVVILSFVRSFDEKKAKKLFCNVGFVADMRRLNVSLSRARCKLIMVGNLNTLTNIDAYSHISEDVVGDKHPINVFRKVSKYTKDITKRKPKDIFIDDLRNNKCGNVLYNCIIKDKQNNIRKFVYAYNGEEIELQGYCSDVKEGQLVDIRYTGDDRNKRPRFWSEADMIKIEKWQFSNLPLDGEIIWSNKKYVKIKVEGIVGTARRDLFNEVDYGTPCVVTVFKFNPNGKGLEFKVQ